MKRQVFFIGAPGINGEHLQSEHGPVSMANDVAHGGKSNKNEQLAGLITASLGGDFQGRGQIDNKSLTQDVLCVEPYDGGLGGMEHEHVHVTM
jgi:hypothetical protein